MPDLRVTIDARMAFHSGIGRYIRGLTGALLEGSSGVAVRLLGLPGGGEHRLEGATLVPFDAGIYTLKEQLLGSWICRGLESSNSVFHFPHYNVPWRMPCRSVVTIHDLTHLELPEFFPAARVRAARVVLRRAVRRAGRIIAVSAATRDALERHLPGSSAKTTVIHHGADTVFRPLPEEAVEAARARLGVGRCFVYAGNDKPHKNLPRLVSAFAGLRAEGSDAELILTCPPAPGTSPPGVRSIGSVSDDELVELYNVAEAVVLPSLNEGFGLPALEAMACGTPVVGSSIEALRELVGDAGLLVDPLDTSAITAALRRLLGERELRMELAARAFARAGEFSWERAAKRTLEVYRELAV